MPQPNNVEVVWRPIPNSSQELALDSHAHHTLYTGARGPGKTETQLMRFRRRVGMGYGTFWRGVLFDREYKNLDDIVIKSTRLFNKFDDGAKFLSSGKDYKWIWPTGEELLFRTAKVDNDYWNYHGQEFPFIGWNELTKYPTGALYQSLMSTNRSSFTPEKDTPRRIGIGHNSGEYIYDTPDGKLLPKIPLEVFSTCNPYGAGHAWVKRRFIDPVPYGSVLRTNVEVFNPQTQQREMVTKTQVAIFGTYKENIYLSPEYVAELELNPDENKRKAWLTGSWDIVAGGALDDVWQQTRHVLPRFQVPHSWRIDRAFDWGSSHPFSVGWFAEANGEEAKLPDGTSFCPPSGTIIQIAEWYGTKEIGTNVGLKMSAGDIAKGIVEREKWLLGEHGGTAWIKSKPWPGPADNQIRDVRETDVDTIETKMAKAGVRWLESDKSAGSRRIGLQLIRDRLEAAKKHKEEPQLYFMVNCRASVSLLPTLPRDDTKLDDVDTTAEDHPYDMVRYRVLRGANRMAKKIEIKLPS